VDQELTIDLIESVSREKLAIDAVKSPH